MKYLLLSCTALMMALGTVHAQRMISPKPATLTDRFPKKVRIAAGFGLFPVVRQCHEEYAAS